MSYILSLLFLRIWAIGLGVFLLLSIARAVSGKGKLFLRLRNSLKSAVRAVIWPIYLFTARGRALLLRGLSIELGAKK